VKANCQPGEHAIAGGGSSSHARVFIYQSVPTSSTEWSAAFSNQSGTAETNVQIRAFVICASP
jgi:hypothetical protein